MSELRSAVEAGLRQAWGRDVGVDQGEPAGLADRGHVYRLRVASAPPGLPNTVIVKQPRLRDGEAFDPNSDRPATLRFFNEWACLEFLEAVCGDSPAPTLYAANAEQGLLVIEDLGSEDSLDQAFMGHDSERAARLLIGLMQTLGGMHADTFGQRARFEDIVRRRKHAPPRDAAQMREWRLAATREAFEKLEIQPPTAFFDELAAIVDRAASPDFAVLVHGDPCPDNCQWDGGRVRLLDFEHGRYDDSFSDGAYPRIHFPTCWCMSRLPDEVAREAERAYRDALARGVPAARDDARFERGMVDASVLWAWTTFAGWHMPDVLVKDDSWGLVTVRQRILFRFGLVADMLERNGWYPGITAATRAVTRALTPRWRDVAEMPAYPAFR